MLKIKQFIVNPIQENTYVIYNEKKECWIVDPGCYSKQEQKELSDFIVLNQLSPKCLLNTHCHLDHVFGNKYVSDTYKLPLHLHEKEKAVLDYAPLSGMKWGLPFDHYEGKLIFLKEGVPIAWGEEECAVLFTPGHSPGSLSFYFRNSGFVLGGDVLFRLGIGRTDLPGGDYQTLIDSIHRELFTLPDSVVVYSGHGPETTIGYEKRNNPYLHQAAR